MGADIHIHFEYKKNDKWYNCDRFQLIDSIDNKEDFKKEEFPFTLESVPYFRYYDAFSLLAGVRGSFQPIKDLEGVPDDMHWLTKEYYDEAKTYCHSYTYYTLAELLEWRKKEKKRWKKLEKKYAVKKEGWDEYIDTGEEIVIKRYKMLDILIDAANMVYGELYIASTDDFRVIMWFDS